MRRSGSCLEGTRRDTTAPNRDQRKEVRRSFRKKALRAATAGNISQMSQERLSSSGGGSHHNRSPAESARSQRTTTPVISWPGSTRGPRDSDDRVRRGTGDASL